MEMLPGSVHPRTLRTLISHLGKLQRREEHPTEDVYLKGLVTAKMPALVANPGVPEPQQAGEIGKRYVPMEGRV